MSSGARRTLYRASAAPRHDSLRGAPASRPGLAPAVSRWCGWTPSSSICDGHGNSRAAATRAGEPRLCQHSSGGWPLAIAYMRGHPALCPERHRLAPSNVSVGNGAAQRSAQFSASAAREQPPKFNQSSVLGVRREGAAVQVQPERNLFHDLPASMLNQNKAQNTFSSICVVISSLVLR